MAKHRFLYSRWTQALRPILLAVLALGLGVSPIWADQQAPKPPARNATPAQPTVQKQKKTMAVPAPATSIKSIVQRKSKTTPAQRAAMEEGKRDPFKLPALLTGKGNGVMDSAPGGDLPPGVRGLLISQLKLEGVVRQQVSNKMIAVVTNETKRAYFLTENESVYNGVVSKITPDAIYFKENVLDGNGRVTTREVMKRLGSAPGEGR